MNKPFIFYDDYVQDLTPIKCQTSIDLGQLSSLDQMDDEASTPQQTPSSKKSKSVKKKSLVKKEKESQKTLIPILIKKLIKVI